MIRDFADRATERLWSSGKSSRFPPNILQRAVRKLQMLDAATQLGDLASVPGNRLEALRGDRKGQHSIRINNQYRICFRWESGDAFEVEVTDYH